MKVYNIDSFASFCAALREVGFSMGGRNDEGIFSLCTLFSDNIVAHTGNKETDPWEWRIRGIKECNDLVYSKVFFNKGGWITKEWLPYFMAIRREHKSFDEMYDDGLISNTAKRIYDLICETPNLSLQEIKVLMKCGKDEKSEFETALTMLQMKLLVTISGEKFKLSKDGKQYGWPVTTFCRIEDRFGEEIFDLSCEIGIQEAVDRITEQIIVLNPKVDTKVIRKFIGIRNSLKSF